MFTAGVRAILPEEAALIGQWTQALGLGESSVCLNLGSSTKKFREETQPFIQTNIFEPLSKASVQIVHCDLKQDEGVDEVGDLLNSTFQHHLIGYSADLVIASNLLEHLTDPTAFAEACGKVVKPGGFCLFTVPRSYPYHPDPLDTMYRPTTDMVAMLLPDWKVVKAAEIKAGSLMSEILAEQAWIKSLVRQVARAAMPFYRTDNWYPAAHKLLWLFRPYRVSLVMLQKPDLAS